MEKKTAKYFAFRFGNVIILRRTVKQLQKVKSVLHRPMSESPLVQITVTGGTVVGTIAYPEWATRTNIKLVGGQCVKVPKQTITAIKPFLISGE